MGPPDLAERRRGMEVFDGLPLPLRQALASAAYPLRSSAVASALNRLRGLPRDEAARLVAAMIPELEQGSLAEFGAEFHARFGYHLPHIAAGATLLRG